MKSVRRLLLWSVVSLALLLAGFLIWSVVFFDPNDYRESIADDPNLRLQRLNTCCSCSSSSTCGAALFWRAACFLHALFFQP